MKELVSVVKFTCPFCGETFSFYDESIKSFADIEGCTCDCTDCGKLLLVRNGKFVDAYATFKADMEAEGYKVDGEIEYIEF